MRHRPSTATLDLSRRALIGTAGAATALALMAPRLARSQTEKIVLTIDWLPTGDKQAGFGGLAQGFFAAEGLDVEIRRGSGAADSLNKVATGASHFGYSDIANVMAARPQGAMVKAIFSLHAKPAHAVITLNSSGITSFADLQGKSLGTAPTASSNLFFPLVMRDAGLDPARVRIVNTDPAALGPMLLTRRVDAAMLWLTNTVQLEGPAREQGAELVVLPFTLAGLRMYSGVLIASDETLARRGDLTRRFLRAMRRSLLFQQQDPLAVARATAALNPQQNPEIEASRIEIMKRSMLEMDPARFGHFDPSVLRETYGWLVRAQNLNPATDPESFVDRSFMPATGT
ncbi:ABC transporter substrate-binding protein [Falsiroseomonas sp.]|uniref:ABC transporter substrate-binding protein n=1 Tax=Falsiroseomonas sp. TaxID=2870721 RepID=UPI003F722C14